MTRAMRRPLVGASYGLNQRKLDLLNWQDDLTNKLISTSHEIFENIRSVESLVQDKRSTTKFLLKVEDGQVVARSPL